MPPKKPSRNKKKTTENDNDKADKPENLCSTDNQPIENEKADKPENLCSTDNQPIENEKAEKSEDMCSTDNQPIENEKADKPENLCSTDNQRIENEKAQKSEDICSTDKQPIENEKSEKSEDMCSTVSLPTKNGKRLSMKDRRYLTLDEKIQIFTFHREVKCSARKLAKVFNIGKTQAGDIIRNGDNYIQLLQYDGTYNGTGKLRPGSVGFEIDRMVHAWYTEMRSDNISITGPMIQNKALDLAKGIGHSEFKASNGWLLRFLRRHKIILKPQLLGEEADKVEPMEDESIKNAHFDDLTDDIDISDSQEWEKSLAVLLPKYSASDIFSVVQTGLFHKAIPSDTAQLSEETCSCGKLSKERCTILFCVNMSGGKEIPLVISNFSKGVIRKLNKSEEVHCVSHEKAWITKNIVTKWLKDIDKKIGKDRNAVLFLNHGIPRPECQYKNIQIVNFPSFFSSDNHPLNQRIIQNFKILYRQQLLKHLIHLKENDENYTLPDKSVSETQAIEWVSFAWKELSESVIHKGFEELGFNPFVQGVNMNVNEISASLNDVSNLLCAFDSDVSAVDYVSLDKDLVTCDHTETVEVLVDHDYLNEMLMESNEEMDTEPQQDITIKSYPEAVQSLKNLKQFYVTQNDVTCISLVNQLMNYTWASVEIPEDNFNSCKALQIYK